jgi:hypothetical protein
MLASGPSGRQPAIEPGVGAQTATLTPAIDPAMSRLLATGAYRGPLGSIAESEMGNEVV